MKLLARAVLVFLFASLVFPLSSVAEDKKEEKKAEETEGSYSVQGIEVIQSRLFQKRGRHELGLSFGILYDNPFVFYEMLPLQYTYHIRETLGIELTAAFAFGQEKDLVENLRAQGIEVKVEKIKRYYSGNFVWSPIYGKFNIFASNIFHFDFFLTTGFGAMDNEITVDNNDVLHFAFNIGFGTKVYINDWFVIRFDFRNFTYKEGAPFEDTINCRVMTIGTDFLFPFHKKVE